MPRTTQWALIPAAGLAIAGAGPALASTGGALPDVHWIEANPLAAAALAIGAGFLDGINPCAITTLLLFIGALVATATTASAAGNLAWARQRTWSVALAFILGIFALYLLLGVGFLEVASLRIFGNTHAVSRVAGLVAVLLGLVMISERFFPGSPIKLGMPRALHGLAHRWGRPTTLAGAAIGGALIGTCTIPCGGAMYLAVAALLATLSSKSLAYSLLLTYNLAFVAPLLVLVAVAASRPLLTRLGRLHIAHRDQVKTVLGFIVIGMGLLVLALL